MTADRPAGEVRVIRCGLRAAGSPHVLSFDITVEDERGVRWITEHQVFRFDMERAPR